MTDKHEGYEKSEVVAGFIEKRLSDNLAAFKTHYPSVYDLFHDYKEDNIFLVYDAEGEINVFDKDKGVFLYTSNPIQSTLDSYGRFLESPLYIPVSSNSDRNSLRSDRYIHSEMMDSISELQLDLKIKEGEKLVGSYFDEKENGKGKIKCNVSEINTMISVSTGLGFDLEKFVINHNLNNLFILEPSKDAFFLSLQLIDWAAIIKHMNDERRSLTILFSKDYNVLVESFIGSLDYVGKYAMACSYIYSGFYQEGQEHLSKKIVDVLKNRVLLAHGFYDDARINIAHTVANFKGKVSCLKADESHNKEFNQSKQSVFIIGNGPSLDQDIAYIKENQNKVIVISCGTALRSLYCNGIKPDVHVELERTAHIPYWIKNSAPDSHFFDYLKDIRLLAISHVHPDLFSLFGSGHILLKSFEAGSELIKSALPGVRVPVIEGTGGSCVHVALTASLILGFRKIYLFGVDMGYKSSEYHHSKYSLYEKLNSEAKGYYQSKLDNTVMFSANFGNGYMSSGGNLPMFKTALELSIDFWKKMIPGGFDVFNCSDGVLIDRTTPFRIKDIGVDFENFESSKYELLDNIFQNFFTFKASSKNAKSIDKKIKSGIVNCRAVTRTLKGMLRPVKSIQDGGDLVVRLYSGFIYGSEKALFSENNSWMNEFYRGSLITCLSSLNTILYSPFSEDERIQTFNAALPFLDEFFSNVLDDIENNISTLDSEAFYDMVE